MRNNESIRAFPIVQVTFITFLVRRNILCSITLRNFTRRWQKVGVTLELKWNGGKAGRKENGGWEEEENSGGIHRISYFLAMHYTRLSFPLSLSLFRPLVHSLAVSLPLCFTLAPDAPFSFGSCTSGTSGNEVRGEWLSAREGLGHVKKGDRGVGSSFPEISLRLV